MKNSNALDKGYQFLLRSIMEYGQERDTRAGKAKSLFGKHFEIDLKDGFPLLTTKKVYFKGVVHELLWFLKAGNHLGRMNIKYLVDNNVNIWNDDAYRWFKEWINRNCTGDKRLDIARIENDTHINEIKYLERHSIDIDTLLNMSKDEFIDCVRKDLEITVSGFEDSGLWITKHYHFGDLGAVYGKQWRSFGKEDEDGFDQIAYIIDTLKNNPTDRRMLCIAFNPSVLNEVALPPCHVMFQFYTRKLTRTERWECYRERFRQDEARIETYEAATVYNGNLNLDTELDKEGIPVYGLSCMWSQRSVDCFLGLPFNIASYALLTHMIGSMTNMLPDRLIGSLGDCHIYENHFDAVREQLERDGAFELPKLKIKRIADKIEDFKFEDLELTGYEPAPAIKATLNVG